MRGVTMNSSDVLDNLACSLGANNELPNIALAHALCESKDADAISKIVDALQSSDTAISNDCIKVLYEIGERNPELIADHYFSFIQLLQGNNNRLIWGGMTALAQIVRLRPSEIYAHRNIVISAYESGSVITVDQSISIFAELSRTSIEFETFLFPIILHHLETCRPKEIPQHAQRAFIAVNESNAAEFKAVLQKRMDLLTDLQQKRLKRLIHSIGR